MRWTLLGLLVLAFGCWSQGDEPPGEPVGTFEAVGLMVEQSCGSAIPAADPLNLTFELRREEGGRAYWRQHGGPIFAGVYKDNEYSFPVSQSWMVIEPDRFHGYVGCSVTQRDVFTFLVDVPEVETEADGGVEEEPGADAGAEEEPEADAGAVDAGVDPILIALSGSQTTEIEPLAGADCTPAVAALGGPFLSLPCRVEYVLTGNGVAIE